MDPNHSQQHQTLETIMDSGLQAYRSILAATEAAATALQETNLEALDEALKARAAGLACLRTVNEETAAAVRKQGVVPGELHSGIEELQLLAAEIAARETETRRAGTEILAALRSKIQTISTGKTVLKRYRGAQTTLPRFEDRKT